MKRVILLTAILLLLSVHDSYAIEYSKVTNSLSSSTTISASPSGPLKMLREENKKSIQELRSQYLANLQALKDARKRTLVSRISTNITTTNQTATSKMSAALDRLSSYVAKMNTRITTLKAQGANTSNAESAVTAAQTAIATAKASVTTQAAKTYVLTIPDEGTLRSTITTTVSELRTDLISTRQTLENARMATIKVAQALALISKPTDTSASSSAAQKPL